MGLGAVENLRILGYPELEGTRKGHRVQLLKQGLKSVNSS